MTRPTIIEIIHRVVILTTLVGSFTAMIAGDLGWAGYLMGLAIFGKVSLPKESQ